MAKRYKQSDQERQIVLRKLKSMFAKVDFEYMLPRDIKRNGRIEKQDMWLELLSTYEYATLQGDGFKKAFANAISNYTNIDCGFKLSDIDLVDPITREKTHVEIFHGELDDNVPKQLATMMADQIKGSIFHLYAGEGHASIYKYESYMFDALTK